MTKATGPTNFIPRVVPSPHRLKRCTSCDNWYPLNCFQREAKNPDGLRNECRACRSERRKELQEGASRRKPWRRKGLRRCADRVTFKAPVDFRESFELRNAIRLFDNQAVKIVRDIGATGYKRVYWIDVAQPVAADFEAKLKELGIEPV